MTGNIVVLNSDFDGTEEEPQLFDSVSSAAVWFAHEMLRNVTGGKRLSGVNEAAFNAVVTDVALLFAGYDRTTEKDPDEVHGGNERKRWNFGLDHVSSVEEVVNEIHSRK